MVTAANGRVTGANGSRGDHCVRRERRLTGLATSLALGDWFNHGRDLGDLPLGRPQGDLYPSDSLGKPAPAGKRPARRQLGASTNLVRARLR